MEKFNGILKQVRYHKSSFLIGIFKTGTGDQTCLGNMLNPETGMEYKLFGKWVDDPSWGKQFRFSSYEACKPKDRDGLVRYLSKTAKWVQEKTARKIVEAFGHDTLEVLRNDPKQVAESISGLSYSRATEIQSNIKANEEIESALVDLEKLIGGRGLRKSLPSELVSKWGTDAPAIVKNNPYLLTQIKGIGFHGADAVALSIKYDQRSVHRQAAARGMRVGSV